MSQGKIKTEKNDVESLSDDNVNKPSSEKQKKHKISELFKSKKSRLYSSIACISCIIFLILIGVFIYFKFVVSLIDFI